MEYVSVAMNTLDTDFGWLFAAMAAIFALGLTPQGARRFYPASPKLPGRLAAPVVFALLAAACFAGVAVEALSVVVVGGVTQIGVSRWHGRKSKTPA